MPAPPVEASRVPPPPLGPPEEFRGPEPAVRSKEKMIVDVNDGINKTIIEHFRALKIPSELIGKSSEELKKIVDGLQQ